MLTVYLRPSPRLPKIVALAAIMDHEETWGDQNTVACMIPESFMPKPEAVDIFKLKDIYYLDCRGNGYRERGYETELGVVLDDFEMDEWCEEGGLEKLLRAMEINNSNSPQRNFLNRYHGSIGWFTGYAWDILDQVQQGNWKWAEMPIEDEEGNIILDQNSEAQFRKVASRDRLTPDDFLQMCLDVVLAHIRNLREKTLRSWKEASESRVVQNLLSASFQGKSVSAGTYAFPTLSRYIRDLFEQGVSVGEIRSKLRPWLSLWRVIENCQREARQLEPHRRFGHPECSGVAFDFYCNGDLQDDPPVGADNPLIHSEWLRKSNVVVVRGPSGHAIILTRSIDYGSVERLYKDRLNLNEPGRWTLQGGGIMNGSKSRMTEVPPTEKSAAELAVLAGQYLKPYDPKPRRLVSHGGRRR